MNLPNKLTVLRMVLVPFFVLALLWPFPHHYLVALILFGAASYTDHLDGKLARKNNQITDFGKFMDPLADKILVISAGVLCEPGIVRCVAGAADYRPGIHGDVCAAGGGWQRESHRR